MNLLVVPGPARSICSLFVVIFLLLGLIGCKKHRRYPVAMYAETDQGHVDIASSTGSVAKKKVIIFTCGGGGGHVSASRATAHILKDDYDVAQVYLIRDIFAPLDPVRTLTFEWAGCEDLYNYLITRRYSRLTNAMCWIGKYTLPGQIDNMSELIRQFIQEHKPDAIISVIPVVNHALITCAREYNIPLIIVPTDLDNIFFIIGLDRAPLDYKYYRYILPFDDKSIRATLAPAQVPDDHLVVGGFPVRPEFSRTHNKTELRKKWGITLNKPVVTVLMGAAGSIATYQYVKRLAKSRHPLHIIACLGRNEKLRTRVARIKLKPHITMSIVGFTDRMAEIMGMSDVLITKCGTVSVCEGIHSQVPLLLDATAHMVIWEEFNINFVTQNGLGRAIYSLRNLDEELEQVLHNHPFAVACRKNLQAFYKPSYEHNIKRLLHELMAEVAQDNLRATRTDNLTASD